jgi:hypothetical protein
MIFTEQELAFLRRFCWELCYLDEGLRPTEERCSGHYNDVRDLADASGVISDVLVNFCRGELTDPAPPEVEFPWESLDKLKERADEVRRNHMKQGENS